MTSTVATRGRDASHRNLAEQYAPIVEAHERLRTSTTPTFDVARARERISHGRAAFEADIVLESAGDLTRAFDETMSAFERAGIASTANASGLRRAPVDAAMQVQAWANGDPLPADAELRVARRVAAVIGNAILRRAAAELTQGATVMGWRVPTCPCCGATPDLALTTPTRRTFACWRCDTTWRAQTRGCLGCGADEAPTIARVPSPYLGYELAICNSCGRYLKERRGAFKYDPLIERMLVAGLDAAAEHRGLRV